MVRRNLKENINQVSYFLSSATSIPVPVTSTAPTTVAPGTLHSPKLSARSFGYFNIIIYIKAIEYYIPMMLFIKLYKVALLFSFVGQMTKSNH